MYNVYFYDSCEPLKVNVNNINEARKHANFYIYQWSLNTMIERIEKIDEESHKGAKQ